jgi:hypothetical protein
VAAGGLSDGMALFGRLCHFAGLVGSVLLKTLSVWELTLFLHFFTNPRRLPLQKAVRRIRLSMMLEYAFNFCPDHDFLHWIAQQVTHHAHAIGMRKLDQHGDVRTMIPEYGMRRVPNTLPTKDAAPWFHFGPLKIERVTAVTQPLGSELPRLTMTAKLYD